MSDLKIMGMVGSLRKASVNGAVARAAQASAGDGISIELFDARALPFYDGDVEEAGLPDAVQALQDTVGAADGLLFFSPEYNGSFPAVTKNAIDWMSRPPKSWTDTPVSMIAITPGPRAGLGVRTHFEAIMEFQPTPVFPTLGIGAYGDKITDGEITDAEALADIADFVNRFADFCRSH